MPTARHEAWKKVDFAPITRTPFIPFDGSVADTLSRQDVANHLIEESAETQLVFINGYFQSELSSVQNLPEGVVISDLYSVLSGAVNAPKALLDYLESEYFSLAGLEAETDALAALNGAGFQNGPCVYVPTGVVLERPVQVLFYTAGTPDQPHAVSHKGLILAEEKASITAFVQFVGQSNQQPYLNNQVFDVVVHSEASVDFTFVQNEGAQGHNLTTTRVRQAENSSARLAGFALNGQQGRHNVQMLLDGEQAYCELNGLNVLTGQSRACAHTEIHHTVPNCQSRQFFKGILNEQSLSEFDGTVVVYKDAQQTDSVQLNRNLLLSDNAQVFTRPQLRIDADDVKCSHGSASGSLSENSIFYLRSRGLSYKQAKKLLITGFFLDVIEKITDEEIKNFIKRTMELNQ